ncbi:hypothetical protein NKR19_g1617 [Coniochaeta hoffmannii]|uniref:Uncharacterized protein n=1 Tax=Coniochaeta hoffmannii TaxID=91930 RepID=A0AA38RY61_9PEZI|nr:hypothetical protein NKR19_g1617 [Coniochaeta hoffmannii]
MASDSDEPANPERKITMKATINTTAPAKKSARRTKMPRQANTLDSYVGSYFTRAPADAAGPGQNEPQPADVVEQPGKEFEGKEGKEGQEGEEGNQHRG